MRRTKHTLPLLLVAMLTSQVNAIPNTEQRTFKESQSIGELLGCEHSTTAENLIDSRYAPLNKLAGGGSFLRAIKKWLDGLSQKGTKVDVSKETDLRNFDSSTKHDYKPQDERFFNAHDKPEDDGHWDSFYSTRAGRIANTIARALEDDGTPLHKAARKNFVETAESLINMGADIEARDKHGRTPLHVAIRENSLEVASLLLERGADIEAKDDNGNTPLHFAVGRRSLATATLLVNNGARIHAKNTSGDTSLDVARSFNSEEVIRLLESQ